jgi:putative transposase
VIQDRKLKEAILIRRELTDQQWKRIENLVPGKPGDKGRAGEDNRLFVDAVLWVLRTGSPWRDLHPEFGNWNSIFVRFRRWARKGVWESLFKALMEDPDFEHIMIDATIVRAHQHAAGAKGGLKIRRSAGRAVASAPRSTSPSMRSANRYASFSRRAKFTR